MKRLSLTQKIHIGNAGTGNLLLLRLSVMDYYFTFLMREDRFSNSRIAAEIEESIWILLQIARLPSYECLLPGRLDISLII
ncbi:MAG: hypothetical protein ACOC4M_17015 [Promethearchaeia archaeon]